MTKHKRGLYLKRRKIPAFDSDINQLKEESNKNIALKMNEEVVGLAQVPAALPLQWDGTTTFYNGVDFNSPVPLKHYGDTTSAFNGTIGKTTISYLK